ncbi:MAG: DUF1957 domain-containing protein [Treponema sp.]|jgi:1,4-alpha-glucan branching enzyme|nr:DUF1957 domain-containing protein [Treponema sp.]
MMSKSPVVSIVLNAHVPFISLPENKSDGVPVEEQWLFEALSETYIPLLQVFERLDAAHIPFRLGLVLSPVLCQMLNNQETLQRYLVYTSQQIEFGARECARTRGAKLEPLAKLFYDRMIDRRIFFTGRCDWNILKTLDYYQKKGKLELLTTAATYAYLPLYTAYSEGVQAQLEVAAASHRSVFGVKPQGFWLPEMGWTEELDAYLRAYNFGYTIVETHGALGGKPGAAKGSFYPVVTPSRLHILIRDYSACRDINDSKTGCRFNPLYSDYGKDPGYELPAEMVKPFLGFRGERGRTGYRYWTIGGGVAGRRLYDPYRAEALAAEQARAFLDARISRLRAAAEFMQETPISLCALDADIFGRYWYEGPTFLEALFREGARRSGEIQFMNPGEYLCKQRWPDLQTSVPGFSSWGVNGYSETWLDSSNDWMYRHGLRSLSRMIELAERFPNDTGLKERALNQAAREILLAQASDWPKLLYRQEFSDYARAQLEDALRNFTTIYESLGSNYISTEWLTALERRHNIFPHINYRIFRHKR